MAIDKQVEDVIAAVLEERFGTAKIVSVDVKPDVDEEGERVLFVNVVFNAGKKPLDARETSGLARRVLPKIEQLGETGFPVFSFIAQSELGKVASDPA